MSDFPYEFDARIATRNFGGVKFGVVYAPKSVLSQLDFSKSKRLRIDGEINGLRFECALMPSKGKWFIVIPKKLQKRCGVSMGDQVNIAFDVADLDAIVVPNELQFALEANDAAMKVWQSWTPGKRRGFCYRVASAKRVETRERRVDEVLELLMESAV